MLISPALLDFLEQALEPIPITLMSDEKSKQQNSPSNRAAGGMAAASAFDLDASSASSLLSSGTYATYATSLPIDVVVYIMVKPSLVRFTCLPVSRVECLLRLPSVDVVFSSYKATSIDTAAFAASAADNTTTHLFSSFSWIGQTSQFQLHSPLLPQSWVVLHPSSTQYIFLQPDRLLIISSILVPPGWHQCHCMSL